MIAPLDVSALPALEVGGRLARVRSAMLAAGCEALVVSSTANIRWLTGFTGSSGFAVVLPDALALVTDGRYAQRAVAETAAAGVAVTVHEERSAAALLERVSAIAAGVPTVGLEAATVSWSLARSLQASWPPGSQLVPTDGLVEGCRAVKDAGEVARIEAAAGIADRALADVLALVSERPTEHELAVELDHRMRLLGATDRSFETIVASGPNSALPHHRPGDRRLQEGDLLICDFGALVDGYCSDITRSFVLGTPSPDQLDLLREVTAAQAAGVAAVAPGVRAADVDAVCRTHLTAVGWGEQFSHGTGHGVGLAIHEAPWVLRTSTAVLEVGNVVTIEPGVYRWPLGGVRVEDTVVVTQDGCRPLTSFPKQPQLS